MAGGMGTFWDARAREDAFWFVDNRLEYGRPDVDRFWSDGEADLDRLLSMAGAEVRPQDAIVDIGCGLGRLTRALAARTRHVHAIDVSGEMLARARSLNAHLHDVTWVHGDGTSLQGIDDGVADGCVSHVVFQHIPDPGIVLGYVREMGRVLRPGGWSAFQVSDDPSVHRPQRGRVVRLRRQRPRGTEHPAWLGSAVDLDELGAAAAAGGLDVERVVGEGTQFCIVLLRRR